MHYGYAEGGVTFKMPLISAIRKKELEEYYTALYAKCLEGGRKGPWAQAITYPQVWDSRPPPEEAKKKKGLFSRKKGKAASDEGAVSIRPLPPTEEDKPKPMQYQACKGSFFCRWKWEKYSAMPHFLGSGEKPEGGDKADKEKEQGKQSGEKDKQDKDTALNPQYAGKEINDDKRYGLIMGCLLCAEMLAYRNNYESPHVLMAACPVHRALLLSPADSPFPGLVPNCRTATKHMLATLNMAHGDCFIALGESCIAYGTICDPNCFYEFFDGLRLGRFVSTNFSEDLNQIIYREKYGFL